MILSLKKVFSLIAIAVLLGVISVYGIQTLTPFKPAQSAQPVTSVLTSPPIELKLELTKTEFEKGEPINVTVSLKNIGNTTINVSFSYRGPKVMFKILAVNDTVLYERGRSILALVEDIALSSGEQIIKTYTWNQTIWIREGDIIYDEIQAPRGTYKIVGAVGASISIQGIGSMGKPETPPIAIKIK